MQPPTAPACPLPGRDLIVGAIRRGWLERVHAEYRSAAFTQQIGHLWLMAGVSPDLVADSHRVVTDELAHASDALRVLAAAGGAPEPLDEGRLVMGWAKGPARTASLRAGLEILALNESLAVPLFAAMRRRATEPTVVAALARIAEDEPRHAALGWTFLHWAVGAWPDARSTLADALPGAVERLCTAYGELAHDRWDDDDPRFAWGLLDGAGYAAILERFVAGPLRVRVEELGLSHTLPG